MVAIASAGLQRLVGQCLVIVVLTTALQASAAGASTGFISEYPVSSYLASLVAGPDASMWFSNASTLPGQIGKIAADGTVTSFSAPAGQYVGNMVAGPDGNIWFAAYLNAASWVGDITPSGTISEYPVSQPASDLVVGADGNVWFRETAAVGRVTPAGVVTEFPVEAGPANLTVGSDGNLWFTEWSPAAIARITPDGTVTEFATPGDVEGQGMVEGADGNLWFTAPSDDEIGMVTTSGAFTMYPAPGYPAHPVLGPDGDVWVELEGLGAVAKVDTSGDVTRYDVAAQRLTPGPDGNLWCRVGQKIARLTPSGQIESFSPLAMPTIITIGPDQHVWFAEETSLTGYHIGTLDPNHLESTLVLFKPSLTTGSLAYGHAVRLTVQLASGSPNQDVSLYATPYGGSQQLIATAPVDASGLLSIPVAPQSNTTYEAMYAGDAVWSAATSQSVLVKVHVVLQAHLKRAWGSRGGFKLYHQSSSAIFAVETVPNEAGHRLAVEIRYNAGGKWVRLAKRRFTISHSGWVVVGLPLRGWPVGAEGAFFASYPKTGAFAGWTTGGDLFRVTN